VGEFYNAKKADSLKFSNFIYK